MKLISMVNGLENAVTDYEFCLEEIKERQKIIEDSKIELVKLKTKQDKLTTAILKYQLKGDILEDSALDYCLRHYDEKIYEHLELVNEFKDQIKKYSGQQILTVRENQKLDIGIISGGCMFEVDKTFRYLYVPVNDLQTFRIGEGYTGNWEKQGNKILIEKDIFDTKKFRFKEVKVLEFLKQSSRLIKDFGEHWDVDYSKQMCIEGAGPNNWHVSIGNKNVKFYQEFQLQLFLLQTS